METSLEASRQAAATMYGDRAVALLRELESRKTDEPENASLVSRFVARGIDVSFMAVVAITAGAVVGAVRLIREGPPRPGESIEPSALDYVMVTALVVSSILLVELWGIIRWRQSPGKKLMGLRVTSADGVTPVTVRVYCLRTLLWVLPVAVAGLLPLAPLAGWAVVAAVLVALAITLSDQRRRAPYDRLLRLRVMRPR
jgi:uncharacterized RDD family membrane protein YckC